MLPLCYKKGEQSMKNTYSDLIDHFEKKIKEWKDLKGNHYDVTHENFIDDVILVYEWVLSDIKKFSD